MYVGASPMLALLRVSDAPTPSILCGGQSSARVAAPFLCPHAPSARTG